VQSPDPHSEGAMKVKTRIKAGSAPKKNTIKKK
jgi:hypothetical protein